MSTAADFGRVHIGMRFGKHLFARYVAPDMRLEGAILSVLTPTLVSYCMYHISIYTNYKYFIKMKMTDYMWLG